MLPFFKKCTVKTCDEVKSICPECEPDFYNLEIDGEETKQFCDFEPIQPTLSPEGTFVLYCFDTKVMTFYHGQIFTPISTLIKKRD